MKKNIFIFIFLLNTSVVWAQQNNIDSLRNIINLQRGDTTGVKTILNLVQISFINSEKFVVSNIDSLVNYLQKALLLAKKIKYLRGEADCYYVLSNANGNIGNYGQQIL